MAEKVKKFGMADKIGYMFGDFGNDFTFILSTMMLMKFYTDVMGVSAAIVGAMMMIARIVDAFTDVTMGQIVDRSKPTGKGKFAPWIRRMCGPVAVASFLMYASWFENMPMAFKIFWMFFTYLLWGSVCYTGVNIPYGSMASAISNVPEHRTQLSNFRTIGATLAGTVIGVILPLVVYYTDADGNSVLSGSRMSIAALFCSIGAVVCYILCYNLTTERVKVEQKTDKFSFGALLKSIATNKALIGIIVVQLCLLLSQLSLQGMQAYIFPNYFKNAAGQSMVSILGLPITLILATFTVKLSTKMGKKELATVGCIIGAVSMIVAYIIHTDNMMVFMCIYAAFTVGLTLFSILGWAMITDVIDDTEVRTGERSDGTIYAVYSFARKLGQAAASGLTGIMLSAIGYTAATQFDEVVVNKIYDITCLVPGIGMICTTLALIFLYPLGKKVVEENVAVLAKKHNM